MILESELLTDYLIYEFDYEAKDNKNLSIAFVRKNKRLQKMFKVEGLCTGQIARLNEKGVVIDISIQLKDSSRECWIGNRMFSYKNGQLTIIVSSFIKNNELVYGIQWYSTSIVFR